MTPLPRSNIFKYLHPLDIPAYIITKELAHYLAELVGTSHKLTSFEPKRRPTAGCALGLCYSNGIISITYRYKRHSLWLPKPFTLAEVIATTAHEVAHLTHFDHSPAFRRLEAKLVEASIDWVIDNPSSYNFKPSLADDIYEAMERKAKYNRNVVRLLPVTLDL